MPEVTALNTAARQALVARGAIGPSVLTVARMEPAVGDQVMLHVNDRALDVQNGARAVIADHVREPLTRAIGARPDKPSDALKWDRALEAVTAFRHAHCVSALDELLDPQPPDLPARLRWLAARPALHRAAPKRDRSIELER